jgi:hypothetical protein
VREEKLINVRQQSKLKRCGLHFFISSVQYYLPVESGQVEGKSGGDLLNVLGFDS